MLIIYLTKVLVQIIIIFIGTSLINFELEEQYKLKLMEGDELERYQEYLAIFVVIGVVISFVFTPIFNA